jgi:zinc protease
MKKIKFYLSLFLILFMGNEIFSQIDRSKQPESGPTPKIDLIKPKSFELKNGLTVLVVEDNKLPTFSLRITIDNPPVLEGKKSGLNSLSNALFGEGSKNIEKDTFNEEVDYLGASISMGMGFAFANGLTKHKERIFELISDAALNPNFEEEELNKEKEKLITAIKGDENNPSSIAQRVGGVLAYTKNHPYGEFQTEESINSVSIKDIEDNYNMMFRPDNAYMVVSGDVKFEEIKKLVDKYFSKWKKSKKELESEIIQPIDVQKTEINLIDMPDAVQSELSVMNITDLQNNSKDHHAALVTNFILGGSFNSYLNSNLREENGWTYGAGSSIARNKWTKSTFRASTSVRNVVTDSAIVETLNEIHRIRNEYVSDKMLDAAKATYLGNFIMSTEDKSLLADFAVNIKTQNLPEDFYETFISKINEVTKEDVMRVAQKYLKTDKLRIVVVGKGSEIADKLETVNYNGKLLPVKYFNKVGEQIEKPVFNKEISSDITAETIINKYIEKIGGSEKLNSVSTISLEASVTIPGAPFKPKAIIKEKSPNLTSMEMSVEGMGTLMKQKFDGNNGYMEQMGQKIPLENDQLESERSQKGLIDELYMDTTTMEIVSLGPVDGKDAYKIKIKENSFKYYDAESGLLIMTEESTTQGGNTTTSITKFSDYREVDGILYAFKREINAGPQKIEFEITSVIFNEEISDDFFK